MPLLIIKSPNKNPRMITLKNRNYILEFCLVILSNRVLLYPLLLYATRILNKRKGKKIIVFKNVRMYEVSLRIG